MQTEQPRYLSGGRKPPESSMRERIILAQGANTPRSG